MIQRQLKDPILNRFFQKKAIILIGARQVGKTTLFRFPKSFIDSYSPTDINIITPNNYIEFLI